MIKQVKKIFKIVRPQLLDVLVYRYDLNKPTIVTEAKIPITIEVSPPANKNILYSFRVTCNGAVVNKNDVYRENRLAKQLGYNNILLLGNSETTPSYQGKGIQSFALSYILQYLAQHEDHPYFYVFVFAHNTKMIKLLEKMGGEKMRRCKVYRLCGIAIYKTSSRG